MKARYVGMSLGALVGGVFVVCFGVVLIALPQLAGRFGGTMGDAFLEAADGAFLSWLRLLGVVTVVQGIYQVGTFFLRAPTLLGRIIRVGDALLSALSIPLLLWLRARVEIIPIYLVRDGGQWTSMPQQELQNTLQWVLLFVAIGIGVGVVAAIVRVFSPSTEDREAARAR